MLAVIVMLAVRKEITSSRMDIYFELLNVTSKHIKVVKNDFHNCQAKPNFQAKEITFCLSNILSEQMKDKYQKIP